MNQNIPIIITFGLTITILGFGIYIWYELDSNIDYNIIHEKIITNQTFVDEINCEKIILTMNTLDLIFSPTQQNEVKQLQEDFNKLFAEKECKK